MENKVKDMITSLLPGDDEPIVMTELKDWKGNTFWCAKAQNHHYSACGMTQRQALINLLALICELSD